MKGFNKQILEAIQRGINLAVDDFDDMDTAIEVQKKSSIKDNVHAKDIVDVMQNFVDLGLPSGTLWAKYNLGVDPTKLNSREDWFGEYYAWGETETKDYFSESTYKFYNHRKNAFFKKILKYCNKSTYWSRSKGSGKPDNLLKLQPIDDVAYVKSNGKYNLPSNDQVKELMENTIQEWKEDYQDVKDLKGVLFTGNNGNQLFIPASGYRWDGNFSYGGCNGYEFNLWTSQLYLENCTCANVFCLSFNQYNNTSNAIEASSRCNGTCCRAVYN